MSIPQCCMPPHPRQSATGHQRPDPASHPRHRQPRDWIARWFTGRQEKLNLAQTYYPTLMSKPRYSYDFTVLFEPAPEGGYVVTCPALPGLVTEGDSLEEARAMAADVIRGYLVLLCYKKTERKRASLELLQDVVGELSSRGGDRDRVMPFGSHRAPRADGRPAAAWGGIAAMSPGAPGEKKGLVRRPGTPKRRYTGWRDDESRASRALRSAPIPLSA